MSEPEDFTPPTPQEKLNSDRKCYIGLLEDQRKHRDACLYILAAKTDEEYGERLKEHNKSRIWSRKILQKVVDKFEETQEVLTQELNADLEHHNLPFERLTWKGL